MSHQQVAVSNNGTKAVRVSVRSPGKGKIVPEYGKACCMISGGSSSPSTVTSMPRVRRLSMGSTARPSHS